MLSHPLNSGEPPGAKAMNPITATERDTRIDALCTWVTNAALGDFDPHTGFAEICERLVDAGVPLLRAHLSMRAVHPLVRSVALTWVAGKGVELDQYDFSDATSVQWERSPLRWMLEHAQNLMGSRLDNPKDVRRFPIFADLAAIGGTEYRARIFPFGDPHTAKEREDGVIFSWVSSGPDGFSAEDRANFDRLEPLLALGAKVSNREFTASNICNAYLGDNVGRRVLEGRIQLGDVDEIPAVIWYSDMRDSTAMADRLPPREFLRSLNTYFDCTAGAVLAHDGEVLRFVGDAVLAVFPVATADDLKSVATRALRAAKDAGDRMDDANRRRESAGVAPLGFGLALHVGTVLYGNIGVATRLEFSVIGQVANEVCRIEGLTKHVGERILVSERFANLFDGGWRDIGQHALSGVSTAQRVFAPR